MASYLQGPFRADGTQGCELFGRFTRCNRDSLSVRVYPEATIFMDVFPKENAIAIVAREPFKMEEAIKKPAWGESSSQKER